MTDDRTQDIRGPGMGLEPTDVVGPPRTLGGKYQLGKLIGEGGMGAVYEAEHVQLGSRVAVKLLAEQHASNPLAMRRARREARAMAAIRHDNIVAVTDTGEEDGRPYIVMELLEGESLRAFMLRQGKLPAPLACAIAYQVLSGVEAAHRQHVIHRDLKPANIFMSAGGDGAPRVKVLDFGVSKFGGDSDTSLTVTGAMLGTPMYMAPEQLRRMADIDGRADLYAVGVMLFQMVTGVLPGANLNAMERQAAVLSGDLPRARQVDDSVPEALDAVLAHAMETDPADRYQDAAAFRDALIEAVPGALDALPARAPSTAAITAQLEEPPSARRRTLLLAAGLLVAAGAGIAGWRLGASDRDASAAAAPAAATAASGPALRIGMATYMPEEAQRAAYEPIWTHVGERLERPVELVIYPGGDELRRALVGGELDLAALSPVNYVTAVAQKPEIELLATPVSAGGSTFEVHIVTRASAEEAGIASLGDLRGRVFCYVPSAASGYLIPRDMLRRAGADPDALFETTRLVDDHVAALRHVLSGRCDATSVYGELLFKLGDHRMSPSAFRILDTSDRIPNDAYVAAPGLSPETTAAARAALLALEPGSPVSEKVLPKTWAIIGFGAVDDAAYERVREALALEPDAP